MKIPSFPNIVRPPPPQYSFDCEGGGDTLRRCFKTSREPRCERCGTRCKARRGGISTERYGDEEQHSSARHTAATRRDGYPCGAGLRSASSATLSVGPRRAGSRFCVCSDASKGGFSNVRQRQLPPGASLVGAPCPAPQLKPSRPRAVLKHLLTRISHR